MSERKFKVGDRVEMTDETKEVNTRRSQRGVVVRYGQKHQWEVFIQRDWCRNADGWHQDAWKLEGE